MIKKLLSYLFPITKVMKSDYSGRIELTIINGRLRLDTTRVNYSYGSLQRILKRALKEIRIHEVRDVLLLGLGGGSVVQTLRNDFHFTGQIKAVDIDPMMVSVAKDIFDIGSVYDCDIVCEDALDFIEKDRALYDLIIVDIFIDDVIPPDFTNTSFWKYVDKRLLKGGYIIFNTIQGSAPDIIHMQRFLKDSGYSITTLHFVEQTNDVLICIK